MQAIRLQMHMHILCISLCAAFTTKLMLKLIATLGTIYGLCIGDNDIIVASDLNGQLQLY